MIRHSLQRATFALAVIGFSIGVRAGDAPVGPDGNAMGARAAAPAPSMDVPIANWAAPQFFNLPRGVTTNLAGTATEAFGKPREKAILDLATFVPITACRLVDTRGLFNPVYGAGGPYAAGEARVYRASGNCGVPAGNERVKAVSLAVTTLPTAASGDIEVISESGVFGSTVVMVIQAGQWNSATTVSAVDVQGDFKVQLRGTAGHVVIDINGYYAATNSANDDYFSISGRWGFDGGLLFVQNSSAIGAAIHARNVGGGSEVRLAESDRAIDVVEGRLRVRNTGVNTDTIAFVHEVVPGNLCVTPSYTRINNLQTEGAAAEGALLLVTQTSGNGTMAGSQGNVAPRGAIAVWIASTTCGGTGEGWHLYASGSFVAGDRFVIMVVNR